LQKRVTIIVFVLALLALAGPAYGQGTSCYPPPCASFEPGSEPTLLTVDTEAAAVHAQQDRSPAPVVVAGLLMMSVSFGLIASTRRSAILRSGLGDEPDDRKAHRIPSARPVGVLSDVH
jgi:hypothetical protein